MFNFSNTYIREHRAKEISLPSLFTCVYLPQQTLSDNENGGVKKRQNKENKQILRMTA